MSDTITLLYDRKLRRPGCVLLQAAANIAPADHKFFLDRFNSADWLISPTPDMIRLTGTREQWENEILEVEKRKTRLP